MNKTLHKIKTALCKRLNAVITSAIFPKTSNWKTIKLKYIARFKQNSTPPKGVKAQFLLLEKLKRGELVLDEEIEVNKETLAKYKHFKEGDILLPITNQFVNRRVTIAKGLKNQIGLGSTELSFLKIKNLTTKKFIFYLLQSNPFIEYGEKEIRGINKRKRIPISSIKEFVAPLPKIEVQKRIVKQLDRKFKAHLNLIKKIDSLLTALS